MFDTSVFGSGNKRMSAFISPFVDATTEKCTTLFSRKCYRCLTPKDAALFAAAELDMWRSDEAEESFQRASKRQLEDDDSLERAPPRKRTRQPNVRRATEGRSPPLHSIGSPDEKPEFRILEEKDVACREHG